MWKRLVSSLVCLVMAHGTALGQWTCDNASPVDLPFEQSSVDTMGPDSWGHWHSFVLDRPAVVEFTAGPCYAPGSARLRLWSECRDGTPDDLVGEYETPNFDMGLPASGEAELGLGEYFLELKSLCVLDWDTWFLGSLRIVARYTIDIEVLSNINPRSRGVVPVAILGGDSFDVDDLDVATLRFGPDGATPRHDLTDPWTYNEHLRDLNLDGFMDLVAHFPTRETGVVCGHESAVLSADMTSGQPVEGMDLVRTVGCRCDKLHGHFSIRAK